MRRESATTAQRNLLPVWLAASAFFVAVVAFFGTYAAVAVAPRVFAGRLPELFGSRLTLGVAMSRYAAGWPFCPWRRRRVTSRSPGCYVVLVTDTRFRCS